MLSSTQKRTTDLARRFLEPANSTHRQYEALRAYFVEGLSSADAARRFGYSPGGFRVLVHAFRNNPDRAFFAPPPKGPKTAPKKEAARATVVALRKQNLSVYDISEALAREGVPLSPVAVSLILKEEGFSRLPRRSDDERSDAVHPDRAAVTDVRRADFSPRALHTKFGGLFLFLPDLAALDLDAAVQKAGLPSSTMVPASHALRALLALKLWGQARKSHVMSDVLDEGLALFAGLNAIPKRAFLTEYSCRIDPACYPTLMTAWMDAALRKGLKRGTSFDLDFHTIPFHGQDALVEKHYVSKRSRRQKGILAFVAQDAQTRVFCYVNADLRRDQQDDEVLRFVEFWEKRTGQRPQELIFDSKLTTYKNLDRLNAWGIDFITLRRRSRNMLEAIYTQPRSAWQRIELDGVSRQYKTPRILDERISLTDYTGPIRQITVDELGHEEPTLLLTNQLRRSAATLVSRYAQRMVVENTIQDGVDFFHMDALSSAVALKVTLDLQLTLMASSLYRLLAQRLGHGYEHAKSRHLFRDFIEASATLTLTPDEVVVKMQKRAHNPLLLAAGFDKDTTPLPWVGGKRLRFAFD